MLKAAATTTGVSIATAGVAFVVNILMSRSLGPQDRGLVALVLQAAYVLTPVVALGVDRTALRGVASRPRQGHVWVITVVAFAVAAAFSSLPAVALVATAATSASLTIERGRGMAVGRLGTFVGLSLGVQAWILSTSTIVWVSGGDDLAAWYWIYVLPAPFLALVLGVRHARRDRRRDDGMGDGVTRLSLLYMLGGLALLLAGRVERLLLPVLSSSAQLGLYMAVATASELITWAARGASDSRVSGWVGRTIRRRDLARSLLRDLSVFAIVAVPVGVAIAVFVVPLLGPAFSEAGSLVVPLCVATVLWSVYLQLSSTWLGATRARRSVSLDSATTVVTAGLVLLLVPSHGAAGAAWACAASYGLMCVAGVLLLPCPASRRPT
ncbi:lipopolysaccharide biosynthesis protein [Aeromicrobium sp.]|uniref:lipopolysaccharide biosynthesis protein n=1 Tax=Aeromicrobium sp. TaxID=1871063 RepID=UPI004033FBE1